MKVLELHKWLEQQDQDGDIRLSFINTSQQTFIYLDLVKNGVLLESYLMDNTSFDTEEGHIG